MILEPIITYLKDPKEFRRFPNLNCIAGITNIGYIYERSRGFRSRTLHEVHKVHPVVRVGPNSLSFSTPAAIKAIYGHASPCFKGDSYVAIAGPRMSILDSVDKGDHARKRRLLSHAFATRNLVQWEFKVVDKTQRIIAQFDRICDDASTTYNSDPAIVDFRKWSNLFTVDAVLDIALSHPLGCLDRGDDCVTIKTPAGAEKPFNYIKSLHAGRRATSTVSWAPTWFRFLRFTLEKMPGFFRTQWKFGEDFDELVRQMTRKRIERFHNGEKLDDLVECLLADKEGNARNLDVDEVAAEVTVFMDAGSDTTAIALTHIMYYLLRTPAALARLRQELKEAGIRGDGIPPYATVKNLPYLRACLDESLRLSPPVAFGLHRKTPPEGMSIDGHWIPGNTTVAVPAYTAHRNVAFFPSPEEFRPERWFEVGAKEAQASFIPFSTGARGCIGRNISYIEQSVLVATLVTRYELNLPGPGWELKREEGFNLWPSAMPLTIQRRAMAVNEG
ncbi:cytochrome P450 [Mariannaea sp. PMI_226]|nr:cytochrome P450 [Mariannaea sp. PMI_226]